MTAPDAFLAGRLVDENDLPPLTACYTIVTDGTLHGKSGFVKIRGDHQLAKDGTFLSPPLHPGKYFLRFFGLLRPLVTAQNDESISAKQSRVFDFFYPNAETVSGASPFEVRAGESVNSVIRVPKPTWFNVSGRVVGNLPAERDQVVVMFQRDMGILEGVGGVGFPLDAGKFAGMFLGGSYSASVHQTTPPEPNGYTRSAQQFGSTVVTINADVHNLSLSLEN
jgi:hypothetical protein